MTKFEKFEYLRGMVMNTAVEPETQEELVEFINNELNLLSKRKASAQKRAAEKRAQSDELTEAVAALLTEELQTVEEITEKLHDESVTRNKVVARLSKLVKFEKAAKEQIKVDGRRVMAYRLPGAEAEAEEEAE